jgi:hypothetical protein
MLVRFMKSREAAGPDTLMCVRPDGSITQDSMARRGILPHHAFHFVIESTLRWHDVFFGEVARGSAIDEATAKLHDRSRAWSRMTQAMQCEALIECLEGEQSGGGTGPADFAANLIAACRRRGVAPPDITVDEVDRVRVALREFGAAWRPLPPGTSLERTYGQ